MIDFKSNLIEYIQTLLLEKHHDKLRKQCKDRSSEELLKIIFKRPSGNNLSLTKFGSKTLKLIFEFWEVEIKKPLTSRQRALIMRACHLPYYISDKAILVFDKEVGFLLTMGNGDNKVIENMF